MIAHYGSDIYDSLSVSVIQDWYFWMGLLEYKPEHLVCEFFASEKSV